MTYIESIRHLPCLASINKESELVDSKNVRVDVKPIFIKDPNDGLLTTDLLSRHLKMCKLHGEHTSLCGTGCQHIEHHNDLLLWKALSESHAIAMQSAYAKAATTASSDLRKCMMEKLTLLNQSIKIILLFFAREWTSDVGNFIELLPSNPRNIYIRDVRGWSWQLKVPLYCWICLQRSSCHGSSGRACWCARSSSPSSLKRGSTSSGKCSSSSASLTSSSSSLSAWETTFSVDYGQEKKSGNFNLPAYHDDLRPVLAFADVVAQRLDYGDM